MYKLTNSRTSTSYDSKLWQGRPIVSDSRMQYWYQAIHAGALETNPDIAILGYACEEGVRRNQGRVGAAAGPEAFRRRMGKLAFHHGGTTVADYGDIICEGQELEEAQQALTDAVAGLLEASIFPIIVGGGHDIAYGHYKGIRQSLGTDSDTRVGIVNFDAHFDLRPLAPTANSGTPFNQILEEYGTCTSYVAVGIQPPANTQELFDIANEHNVEYIMSRDCQLDRIGTVLQQLTAFARGVDHLYITIDMDGFDSSYAPGVSAPSPMGMTPRFVTQCLHHLFATGKVISCDFAELNPTYDVDGATVHLTARLVDEVVGCWIR